MSTVVKKKIYTTANPDGTTLTTTTTTKTLTREDQEDEIVGEYYQSAVNIKYCCRPSGILRIIEIICGLVVLSCISSVYGTGPFKGILFGQTFILVFTGICVCITFILLIVYFFSLHQTHLSFFVWRPTDIAFSASACLIFLACAFLEAYYSTGAWATNCNDINGSGLLSNGCRTIYEWAFAAAFMFIMSLLYAASTFIAYRNSLLQ